MSFTMHKSDQADPVVDLDVALFALTWTWLTQFALQRAWLVQFTLLWT